MSVRRATGKGLIKFKKVIRIFLECSFNNLFSTFVYYGSSVQLDRALLTSKTFQYYYFFSASISDFLANLFTILPKTVTISSSKFFPLKHSFQILIPMSSYIYSFTSLDTFLSVMVFCFLVQKAILPINSLLISPSYYYGIFLTASFSFNKSSTPLSGLSSFFLPEAN